MKLFFAKLFFLMLLVGAIVVHHWWRLEQHIQALGPVHGSRDILAKFIKLGQTNGNARLVIAGDSKAERQIDPRVFAAAGIPAANVAIPSGDLWSLVHTIELLNLHKFKMPYLISVGGYQINDGNIGKEAVSADLYFSFTPWERLRVFGSTYFLEAYSQLKYENVYRNIKGFMDEVRRTDGFYPNGGFFGQAAKPFSCIRMRHNSQASPYATIRNIKTDGARWRLFQEAIKKLESWGNPYVLYTSPPSKKGRECFGGTYAEDLERDFAAKVKEATKDLKRVRFVDLYFNAPFTIDDSHYYDPEHLGISGAQIFSQWWVTYMKTENLLL